MRTCPLCPSVSSEAVSHLPVKDRVCPKPWRSLTITKCVFWCFGKLRYKEESGGDNRKNVVVLRFYRLLTCVKDLEVLQYQSLYKNGGFFPIQYKCRRISYGFI